jgi:CheY-like chemotaxis protein
LKPTEADKQNLRILIAEDNPVNQKIAIAALRSLGHTGVVVNDGEKALRCLRQLEFDLVLMDVVMPHMDGEQALREIRELERLGQRHMPVIMLTSNDFPSDRQRFLDQGADGYLLKPLDLEQLKIEMRRVLRLP